MKHCALEVALNYGVQVTTAEGNTYYKIPYWFSFEGDAIVMHKTEVPEDLKKAITAHRLGGDRPRIKGWNGE